MRNGREWDADRASRRERAMRINVNVAKRELSADKRNFDVNYTRRSYRNGNPSFDGSANLVLTLPRWRYVTYRYVQITRVFFLFFVHADGNEWGVVQWRRQFSVALKCPFSAAPFPIARFRSIWYLGREYKLREKLLEAAFRSMQNRVFTIIAFNLFTRTVGRTFDEERLDNGLWRIIEVFLPRNSFHFWIWNKRKFGRIVTIARRLQAVCNFNGCYTLLTRAHIDA